MFKIQHSAFSCYFYLLNDLMENISALVGAMLCEHLRLPIEASGKYYFKRC
jgi:hypothetical protein